MPYLTGGELFSVLYICILKRKRPREISLFIFQMKKSSLIQSCFIKQNGRVLGTWASYFTSLHFLTLLSFLLHKDNDNLSLSYIKELFEEPRKMIYEQTLRTWILNEITYFSLWLQLYMLLQFGLYCLQFNFWTIRFYCSVFSVRTCWVSSYFTYLYPDLIPYQKQK